MKDTIRSAVVAVLGVLAVAFAAATLDSTVSRERAGQGGPGPSGQGDGVALPPPEPMNAPGETLQIPFLTEILSILGILLLLAIVAYAVVYRRDALVRILAVLVLIGLLFALFQFLVSPSALPVPEPVGVENATTPGGGGGSETTQPSPPSLFVLLVVGLALAGTVALLFGTSTTDAESADETEDGADSNAAAVGRAAARAADRIEREADADNEVFRAWREMTEFLDVDDPETSTPGEFATAAIDAGLGRENVDELTRLFEDVRYGDVPASDEYERRAVAVFRRIESQYAEDES